jgi:hypothetical protein
VADAVIQQIAAALLAHAAQAGYVSVGLLTDVGKDWHEVTATPAGYLGDRGLRNTPSPTRSISVMAGLFLFSVIKGEEPTKLFWACEKAFEDRIALDPTLGGLCHAAHVTGYTSDKTVPNVSARTHVADIFIEVEYRHDRGNA